MRLIAILAILCAGILIGGCASRAPRIQGPSVAGVRTGIETARRAVAVASGTVEHARAVARTLPPEQSKAIDADLAQAAQQLADAQTAANDAESQTTDLQSKIDEETKAYAATSAKLLVTQNDLSDTIGSLWKWRIIAVLEALAVAAYVIGGAWLKLQFPFLSRFLP